MKINPKSELLRSIAFPLLITALIWLIELGATISNVRLITFGIYPRTAEGLIGIITSPFIHGDLDHILSNTGPLLIVSTGLIYFYKELAYKVMALIWVMTGFWVWMFARPEWHIGASGLIYGFVCFLFFSGILRKDTRLTAISLLVTFLYGSLVWGILPVNQLISWESHLLGSVAGIFCAFYFRKEGPQKPKAQWEIDEENELLNPTPEIVELNENVNTEIQQIPLKIVYTIVDKPTESPDNKGV